MLPGQALCGSFQILTYTYYPSSSYIQPGKSPGIFLLEKHSRVNGLADPRLIDP